MSLRHYFQQLEPRERRLLNLLLGVLAGLVLPAVVLGFLTMTGSRRSHNTSLRDTIQAVQQGRERVKKRGLEHAAILERYVKPPPELAGFLEALGRQNNLEIPESQPQPVIPHGAEYDEKPTKIVFRHVGMYSLTKFMEGIEQSGYPIVISRLNIRKRGTENDSYDVEMVVSAFERKAKEQKKPGPPASGAAGAKGDDQAERSESEL